MPNDALPAASGPLPATSVVVERPPPGLLRGKAPAPPWLIAGFGAIAILILIAFYLRRSVFKRAP